jgi:agmatinase
MANFDPNTTALLSAGIFGLPFTEDEAQLVIQPVPWEVTTSYGDGTSRGPDSIWQESGQVDLYDLELKNIFEKGIFCREIPQDILRLNDELKAQAKSLQNALMEQPELSPAQKQVQEKINASSARMNAWLYESSKSLISRGKIPAVLGGDHSSPLGLMQAVSEAHGGQFGVLHIDAHADLRTAYQGFTYSHASIMYNLMSAQFAPTKLVQVGIRDFCQEEFDYIADSNGKIQTFFDWDLKKAQMEGASFATLAESMIHPLPKKVFVSFDIDGLDPAFCPNTGTPVPGGLSFDQAVYLIRKIVNSGRQIVGFDLNEVSAGPDQDSRWDAVVGARMLYKLACYTLASQSL